MRVYFFFFLSSGVTTVSEEKKKLTDLRVFFREHDSFAKIGYSLHEWRAYSAHEIHKNLFTDDAFTPILSHRNFNIRRWMTS